MHHLQGSTRIAALAAALLLLAAAWIYIHIDPCQSIIAMQSWACVLGMAAFKVRARPVPQKRIAASPPPDRRVCRLNAQHALQAAALACGRGVVAKELAAGASTWRVAGAWLLPVIPADTGRHHSQHTEGANMHSGSLGALGAAFQSACCNTNPLKAKRGAQTR
jgi:hypothetical protein